MQTDDSEMTVARLSALTPAEQAVLDQALTGVTAREIAEHLSLSGQQCGLTSRAST